MTKFSVKLEGADRLAAIFVKAQSSGTLKELGQAVFGTANEVMNESKRIVPVDTGTLKDSGRVEKPYLDSNGVEVELSYGGAASKYAEIVHEDMKARHADGKSAKYLEKPVRAAERTFVRDVARRYARNLR